MRHVLRLLLSATIGVFVTSLVLLVADVDDSGYVWLLPVSGTVMGILLTLVGIGSAMAGVRMPREKDVEAAVRENRVSLARVVETRATGTTVNDQPLCEIRLVVASRTRSASTTTPRALVNPTQCLKRSWQVICHRKHRAMAACRLIWIARARKQRAALNHCSSVRACSARTFREKR